MLKQTIELFDSKRAYVCNDVENKFLKKSYYDYIYVILDCDSMCFTEDSKIIKISIAIFTMKPSTSPGECWIQCC